MGVIASQQDGAAADAARAWHHRLAAPAVTAVLAAGVAALVYGFVRYPDAIAVAWHDEGRRAVAYALGAAAAFAALALWRRWPLRPAAVIALAAVAASAVGLGAVAAVALVLASSVQVGFLLLSPAREARALHAALAAVVGLAAIAAVLQLAGRLPIHYPLVHGLGLTVPFLFGGARVRLQWRELWTALTAPVAGGADLPTRALWAIAAGGVVIRFIAALAPEVGVDAMGMHLQMPWMVARDHGWWPARTDFVWAWMPLAVNWTYATAFQLGGEPAVRLLNFAGDLLTLALCAGAAHQWRGPRAGAVAAVIYSTLPLRYLLTASVFVETLWAMWLAGAALLMTAVLQRRAGAPRDYVAIGLLVGAALASKLMTTFWAPLVALFVLLAWRGGLLDLRRFVAVAVAASVVGLFPYAVAWVETGNPVFPFMNEVFRSPLMPPTPLALAAYHEGISATTLFDATFHTDRYLEASPGALGLTLLALLPAGLLAAAWRGGRWALAVVVASLIAVALCFHFTAYLRYIAPAFPLWAVLVAGGLEAVLGRPARMALALVAALTGAAGLALSANSTWGYRFLPPLGPVDPARYDGWENLQRPEMRVVRRINDLGLTHVLWIGRPYFVGMRARVSVESWHQNAGFHALATRADLEQWVASRGIDGIVITPGIAACDTVVCHALDTLGEPDLIWRGVRFYRLSPGQLKPPPHEAGERKPFSAELLVDPDLTGGEGSGWTGTGTWDAAAGTMRVTSTQRFSQEVAVDAGERYVHVLRTRCTGPRGYYRAQIDWKRADGSARDVHVETFACDAEWSDRRIDVTAPDGAVTAVVHVAGQDPAVPVEYDRVELRR